MGSYRVSVLGKILFAAVLATFVLSIVAPERGLIAAILLVLLAVFVLAEGFVGTWSGGRETWATVEADRKRDALDRRR